MKDTAISKMVKTLIWVAFSAAVTAVLTYISGHQELFSPQVVATVGVINALLVVGKNFADPKVKNW